MNEDRDERSERRRHERYPVSLAVTVRDGDLALTCRTVNISRGGLLIAERLDRNEGSVLDLLIGNMPQPVPALLVMRSIHGSHFAFAEDLDDHSDLARLIERTEAQVERAERQARNIP